MFTSSGRGTKARHLVKFSRNTLIPRVQRDRFGDYARWCMAKIESGDFDKAGKAVDKMIAEYSSDTDLPEML